MEFLYESEQPYILTEEAKLELNRKNDLYNRITQSWPYDIAKTASKSEREAAGLRDSTLVYGEIDFYSIGEIFETIKARYGGIPSNGVYYDLGSGSGKGVVAGALLHNFEKCIGLELLKSLYDISLNLKANFDEIRQNENLDFPEISFEHGDMFERGWADADFIFANSTCYSHDMMRKIADFPVKLGTWALTTSWGFDSPKWQLHEASTKKMSWGDATVYIQQRITN